MFKHGDKVKCIEVDSYLTHLNDRVYTQVGKTYTINCEWDTSLVIQFSELPGCLFYSDRFELVKNPTTEIEWITWFSGDRE